MRPVSDATEIVTRPASVGDAAAMTETFALGFETYREFAPPGWEPPPTGDERDQIAERLADAEVWALLALAGDEVVGHVAFAPARERSAADLGDTTERPLEQTHTLLPRHSVSRPYIPGMAHLWQLFVRPAWWGRGVAPLLHDRCIAAMRDRGFVRARLFTPARQERARAFYERRGWLAVDEQYNADLQFDLAEYRRDL